LLSIITQASIKNNLLLYIVQLLFLKRYTTPWETLISTCHFIGLEFFSINNKFDIIFEYLKYED